MEGFGPIALFVLWVVVSLLGRAAQGKKKQQQGQRPPRPEVQPRDRPAARTGQPSTFEELLAEMRGELDRARQMEQQHESDAAAEPWQRELEGAEEVEDRTSLEEEPEIVSLEVEQYRPERPVEVAESDATQVLVQKRIAAAEQRNREWRLDDHRQFDAAIRAPKPVEVRRLSPAHQTLRQAIIWNEVLQPPVSLRDGPRSDRGA